MVRLYVNSVAKHTVIIIYFIHCKLYFISRSRKNVYAAPDSTKIFNVALRIKSFPTLGLDSMISVTVYPYNIDHRPMIFTRDSICYSAYMPRQFRLSVRPPVRLSHACIVSKRLNVSSKFFHGQIGPPF